MRLLTLLALSLAAGLLPAQTFTAFTGAPLGTATGDSRSVNLVDINNDGFDDVFISNGPSGGQNNELYLNLGQTGIPAFQQVTNDPIVQDNSPSDGATFADADNDGDPDAFVVTWYGHRNYYYRNNGNGQFTLVNSAATGTSGTYSETAAFGDFDNDGLVDLYITNSAGDNKNLLYHNAGNHAYAKVSAAWLNEAKPSRGAIWGDYDNNGVPDLYVCHEGSNANSLFVSTGGFAAFTKVIGDPSVATTPGSMTASWGDVNNDGFLDLFVGNSRYFQEKNNQLFLNTGSGTFSAAPSGPISSDGGCSFGSAFADYDNDGDLDLFVSNGFCTGNMVNFLYRNTGSGIFERDTTSLPTYNTPCSFGAAWGDLNNDGFQDLVVSTCKNDPDAPESAHQVFLNNGNNHHWLKIRLTGMQSNTSAIGAKIRVTATMDGQQITQMREISAQTGYCGQNSLTAHFGLGDAATVEQVEVRWPSGLEQLWGNIAADQTLSLTEGTTAIAPVTRADIRVLVANSSGDNLAVTVVHTENLSGLTLSLADVQGKTLFTRTEKHLAPGRTEFQVPAGNYASGVYVLQVSTPEGWKSTVKVVLRKD